MHARKERGESISESEISSSGRKKKSDPAQKKEGDLLLLDQYAPYLPITHPTRAGIDKNAPSMAGTFFYGVGGALSVLIGRTEKRISLFLTKTKTTKTGERATQSIHCGTNPKISRAVFGSEVAPKWNRHGFYCTL